MITTIINLPMILLHTRQQQQGPPKCWYSCMKPHAVNIPEKKKIWNLKSLCSCLSKGKVGSRSDVHWLPDLTQLESLSENNDIKNSKSAKNVLR
jgi:hypothetical protein